MDALKMISHQHMHQIWQTSKLGEPLEGEEAVIADAMREHSEYTYLWDQLDVLPDDKLLQAGVNPVLHIQMHAIIENQLSQNDPAEVKNTLSILLKRGLSRHEAVHRIAGIMIEEIFEMQQKRRNFNEKKYLRELKKLIQ
jgi:hypothetical protein